MNVRFKRSSVAGRIPTPASMYEGEVLLNTADKKGYLKGSDGVVYCVLKQLDSIEDVPYLEMSAFGAGIKGTMIFSNGDGTFTALAPGLDGQVLTVSSDGSLQWGAGTPTSSVSITSISPSSAVAGTSVTIAGTNFGAIQGTSTISFNGTAVTTVSSWSATSITCVVPTGASTGNVTVTVGEVTSNGYAFIVSSAPIINSINPVSGNVGASITINGANFGSTQGSSYLTINGTSVVSYTSWSATQIVCLVPTGATTGQVIFHDGSTLSNGVTFTVTTVTTPAISSLNPTSGIIGSSVTITGTNFGSTQGTSTVTFNGTSATASSWSATSIVCAVPSGASTGNVVVTVNSAASNGVSFTVTSSTPAISNVLPYSNVNPGASITISGTNFGTTQGSSTVTVGGTSVGTATSWGATSIVCNVPSGATAGSKSVVVTVGGNASNAFSITVVLPLPAISGITPSGAHPGENVTIAGANFGTTQGTVTFNESWSVTIVSWSATSIVVTIPAGIPAGAKSVVVIDSSSVASSGYSYTVVAYTPTITSLNPTSGPVGTSVTITGTNFGATQSTSSITFNGTSVTSVTSWSATSIVCLVPSGATTGNVAVTVGGVTSSGVSFTVTVLTPSITSLSPSSGPIGSSVTIYGTNFGTTQGTVFFNGVTASVSTWTNTSITVTAPSATSGGVTVLVGSNVSNSVTFTYIVVPHMTGVSPTSGLRNTTQVTVTGTNFPMPKGTYDYVYFDGYGATTYASWSATQIVCTVPASATTGYVSVGSNQQMCDNPSQFTFTVMG